MNYVLITAARNEETFIEKTLQSVCAQTVPPLRWVIVDDGSTDRTPQIVEKYSGRYPWIELVRRPQRQERSFAGKVAAINTGLERVKSLEFGAMGNLDADVSFGPDYLEFLLDKLSGDEKLGIVGTPFTQDGGYDSTRDSFEGENYVAGPCQIFRYSCFKDIGGYISHKAGGIDFTAVMSARMRGWIVRSFPEKRFHHHRSMGTAQRGELSALFSYGEKDYYLGGSPVWQLFRVAFRMTKRPVFFGGVALFLGYSWAALRRMKRPVSPELVRYYRREQMARLKAILKSAVTLKGVDGFRTGASAHQSSVRPVRAGVANPNDVQKV